MRSTCRQRSMYLYIQRITYFTIILFVVSFISSFTAEASQNIGSIRFLVKSSPNATYGTEITLTYNKLIKEIEKKRQSGKLLQAHPLPDTTLHYHWNNRDHTYGVTAKGDIVDLHSMDTIQISGSARAKLIQVVQGLRTKHYGELLTWEETAELIPRYSKFTVMDLETGLSFRGQRRAGSNHADVQPLTKEDSRIMKDIFGGKWSWNRRAVLIHLNGRQIAGSMHGMPHGGDGIPDNAFNGHFCIHFLGSTTHRSGHTDVAHHAMIHKAAGRLSEYMSSLSPAELIDVWIAGVHQKDKHLLQAATGTEQLQNLPFDSIRKISTYKETDASSLFHLEIPIDAMVTSQGSGTNVRLSFVFRLERVGPTDRWYIRSVSFN